MAKNVGKHFGTDTTKILEILTHRLYSESDIFLKELISNGSDACNKLNFFITNGEYKSPNEYKKKIFIQCDENSHQLTIIDNGIGMNDDDMDNFLGTIASSNTRNTIEQFNVKSDLIGQFGIGFYSCFMVADEVKVWSKKYNSSQGYVWSSNGKESYTIINENNPFLPMDDEHGTQIQLTLKEDFRNLTNKFQIREIIRKYSNYISVPIVFYDEQDKNESINEGNIPWRTSNLTEENAKNIYKNILGGMGEIFSYFHQKLQGKYDYTRLIFIPSKSFFIPITRDHKPTINIYLNGVFVCNDENFLPLYLRFIKGLVEFEDMPINISRENFLQNSFVESTKKSIKHKILEELIKSCENNREKYITDFWDVYGGILKEGILEDFQDKSMIFDCCLFKSGKLDKYITVKEYITAMNNETTIIENADSPKEENIYYFLNKNEGNHPMVESFMKNNNCDVLVLKDELEKICLDNGFSYENKKFVCITDKQADYTPETSEQTTLDSMKNILKDMNNIKGAPLDQDVLGFIIKEQNFMNFSMESTNKLTININHPLFKKAIENQDNLEKFEEITRGMLSLIKLKESSDKSSEKSINKIIESFIKSL